MDREATKKTIEETVGRVMEVGVEAALLGPGGEHTIIAVVTAGEPLREPLAGLPHVEEVIPAAAGDRPLRLAVGASILGGSFRPLA